MPFETDFTIGVEEELLLVERDGDHRLHHDAERLLAAMRFDSGHAGHEAYAAEIELRSPVCTSAAEAMECLATGRRAARAAGATLMGSGVHPTAALGDARLVDHERYRRVGDEMRGLIRRTPECALHVHVGMPDSETAIRAYNGLRAWLPLLQALSANSPWWFGADSGLASARWALTRAYPGRGVPHGFHDYAEYEETVAAAVAAGDSADYTHLWWDVRPHPRLGTVEVREMDAQAGLDDATALAALIRALARWEAERGRATPPAEAIDWSVFRAARDGLDADLLDADSVLRPAREVARDVVARVRPIAAELGDADALDDVVRILEHGGGAARQRATAERDGAAGLVRWLVEETYP